MTTREWAPVSTAQLVDSDVTCGDIVVYALCGPHFHEPITT